MRMSRMVRRNIYTHRVNREKEDSIERNVASFSYKYEAMIIVFLS